MEKKISEFDSIIYILACIISFGFWWIFRVVISIAIRKAFENKN